MTRPLADLANDLRAWDSATMSLPVSGIDDCALLISADFLDLVERHLGPTRPPCDTCGGTAEVPDLLATPRPCPDPHCDGGRLAWDEHLRRVAAVWVAVHSDTLSRDGGLAREDGSDLVLSAYDLRQVGRQP